MIDVRVACLLEYPVQTYGTPNILQHWRLLRHVGMRRFAPRESNELWWWKDSEGLRIPFKRAWKACTRSINSMSMSLFASMLSAAAM